MKHDYYIFLPYFKEKTNHQCIFTFFVILIVDEETIKLLRNNQYMLRESLRLLCFQNGVGWGVGGGRFLAKIRKYQGTFCGGWVGPLPENSFFSESTP